jgi:uncharacterized RDD family membrane protein YckC
MNRRPEQSGTPGRILTAMEADPTETTNDAAQRAFGHDPAAVAAGRSHAIAEPQLSDWWTRAAALVLDAVVVAAVAVAVAVVAIAVTGRSDDHMVKIITYAIGVPLGIAYAPLLMIRRGERNGQTLGKQAMGIRVVRDGGAPIALGTAVLRELIGRQLLIAVTFYLYAVPDYLWPIWDRRNQCLHDKIASTLVVRTAAPASTGFAPAPLADEAPVRGWLPPNPGA